MGEIPMKCYEVSDWHEDNGNTNRHRFTMSNSHSAYDPA